MSPSKRPRAKTIATEIIEWSFKTKKCESAEPTGMQHRASGLSCHFRCFQQTLSGVFSRHFSFSVPRMCHQVFFSRMLIDFSPSRQHSDTETGMGVRTHFKFLHLASRSTLGKLMGLLSRNLNTLVDSWSCPSNSHDIKAAKMYCPRKISLNVDTFYR